MKPMERIKELENKRLDTLSLGEIFRECQFIFKAFRVMREIAIYEVDSELTGTQSKKGIAQKSVDEEFEKRMAKSS